MKSIVIILVAITLATLVIGVLFARERVVAEAVGPVRDLTATEQGLFWITAGDEKSQGQSRVWHLPPGAATPVPLLQAPDIRALCVTRGAAYALMAPGPDAETGALVVRDLHSATERRLRDLRRPAGLWSDGNEVIWTETRDAVSEGIGHVPILGAVSVIRTAAVERPEAPRTVAVVEASGGRYDGRLLGVCAGKLYWTEQVGRDMPGSCTLVRRGTPGADPETMCRARGPNLAALDGDRLLWTAPSEEMAEPMGGRVVRSMPATGGEVCTVTDWLPNRAALVAANGRVYMAGWGWLWQVLLPGGQEPLPLFRTTAWELGSLALQGNVLYVAESRDGRHVIRRCPMWWRGHLSRLLRPWHSSGRADDTKGGESL